MSRKGGGRPAASASMNGVSAIDDDSLECLSALPSDTVPSNASNRSLGQTFTPDPYCQKPDDKKPPLDRQPSLQELIEAELTARLAPLQPDSLEALLEQECHEHTRSTVRGGDVTNTCTTLLDSLEAPPFSLDSLADVESGVDLTSPPNPPSGNASPPSENVSPPLPGHHVPESTELLECFDVPSTIPLNRDLPIQGGIDQNQKVDPLLSLSGDVPPEKESSPMIKNNTEILNALLGNDLDPLNFEINKPIESEIEINYSPFILQSESVTQSTAVDVANNINCGLDDFDPVSNVNICSTNQDALFFDKESNNHDCFQTDLIDVGLNELNNSNNLVHHHVQAESDNSNANIDPTTIDLLESGDTRPISNEIEITTKLSEATISTDEIELIDKYDNVSRITDEIEITNKDHIANSGETLLQDYSSLVSSENGTADTVTQVANDEPNVTETEHLLQDELPINSSEPQQIMVSLEHEVVSETNGIQEDLTESSSKDLIGSPDVVSENDEVDHIPVFQTNNGAEHLTNDIDLKIDPLENHDILNEENMIEAKVDEFKHEVASESINVGLDTRNTENGCSILENSAQNVKNIPDPFQTVDVTNTHPCGTTAPNTNQTSDVEDVSVKTSQLLVLDVTNRVADKAEEELWPEENSSKVVLDEFQLMEQEVALEMEKDKKKRDADKKGKKKKKRKGDAEKENKKTTIQNRDQLYEKHVGPRIRSFDAAKMKNKFNKPKEPTQVSTDCRICGKQVFQMEKIVAEKASWHKNCFRCKECNKNLTLETYQSHEGSLYCKPHFKELFRPKAVVQDEAEQRKDRQMRRPRMIVLESQPEALPEDVVRATEKPDYGLEELHQTLNVKERFAVFENLNKETERPKAEPISVRRSQSLMSKAARFLDGQDDKPYGDADGDFDDEEDEEEEEEEEDEEEAVDEEGSPIVRSNRRKKERPMSFSGMGDLKAAWEQKQRREEMSQNRKEEISRFRQMLCAGKNSSLKERFESGRFDENEDDETSSREQIKIEGKRAASNLKKRFEQGEPFILEDEDEEDDEDEDLEDEEEEGEEGAPKMRRKRRPRIGSEQQEVEEIFKEAETAKKARNVFKQIDSKVAQEGNPILRSHSFATPNKDNRRSLDNMQGSDDMDILGRDPNLIKCTDNYQDEIDCRNTKNILQMFKKMEMGDDEDDEEEGPRPLKRFTPPPDGAEYDDESEEYSDEEYSDEEEEEEEEDEDEDGNKRPKIRDELLEMANPSQSARKAANLRAKFERWEAEVALQNDINKDKDDLEECMPSLDTAKNLKAMFEHKANEVAKPVASKPITQKVNRFVGGGGDKCVACNKTVYAMEKLEIHQKILHKNCFKCQKCNTKLSMGSFSFGGDHMYCTIHYKQLFTEKGSYDAFTQEKGKWTKKIEAMNGEETKSHD